MDEGTKQPASCTSGEPSGWDSRPCVGTDLYLWFGPADGEPAESPAEQRFRVNVAKSVCGGCPFVDYCLAGELGRSQGDQWGVRGGLTASERQALIRQRRRAAA